MQSNLSTVFIFASCEIKDCYRVVSEEQLGLIAARTASKQSLCTLQATHFSQVSRHTPSRFMPHKLEISAGLMSHLARMQTFLPREQCVLFRLGEL